MLPQTAKLGISFVALACVLAMACGCRSFTSPARSHDLGEKIIWLDYDASRRGTIILPADSKARILSEPSPDVAIGVVSEFVGKASYKGISGEESAKVTESISELGKRTQTIMFLRESLFRLNEMQTVTTVSSDKVIEMYELVLKTALELAQADKLKEAQKLPPDLVAEILSPTTAVAQKEFDELMKKKPKATILGPDNKPYTDMRTYAQHLVETTPEFKDDTVYGIRANGGDKLQHLIDALKKAVE